MPANEFADKRDRRLLQQFVAGDREAFGELAAAHYDRLWAVAIRITKDPEEAADAVQDGLISAMRNAEGFRGDAKVTTWLHRIVVNACLDRYRKRQRTGEVATPDDLGWEAMADPTDRLSNREVAIEVEAALRKLPLDQRAAVVLVDVQGWSIVEAADILGIPPGTVKSRCFRGRAKLASELGHLRNHNPARRVEPDAATADTVAPTEQGGDQ